LIIAWTFKVAREKGSTLFNRVKWIPLLLVLVQVVLGIAAVLTSLKKIPQQWGPFEWNAQLHQATAMLLLLSLVTVLFVQASPSPSKGGV
jgi:cytochrome c oxidase assembly protein subunit 15